MKGKLLAASALFFFLLQPSQMFAIFGKVVKVSVLKFGNVTRQRRGDKLDKKFACMRAFDAGRTSPEQALPKPPTGSPEIDIKVLRGISFLHFMFYDKTVGSIHWKVVNVPVDSVRVGGDMVRIPAGARAAVGKERGKFLFDIIARGGKLGGRIGVMMVKVQGALTRPIQYRKVLEGKSYLGSVGYLPPCPPKSHRNTHEYRLLVIGTPVPVEGLNPAALRANNPGDFERLITGEVKRLPKEEWEGKIFVDKGFSVKFGPWNGVQT